MCTCIASLIAQVRLICSWCMNKYLRRAAHISAERLIPLRMDMQTEKRYGDQYGCEYSKSVYIYGPSGPREDQPITKSNNHPKYHLHILKIE